MPAFGNVDGARVVVSGISSDVTQNVNVTQWFGSTAPTVGQKVAASSIPVVVATDQGTINTGVANWIGSTAPTVGQKTMVDSVPVVIASDQAPVEITGSLVAAPSQPTSASSYASTRSAGENVTTGTRTLYSIYAHNDSGSAVYLLLFNTISVPPDGTVPVDFFEVPANSIATFQIPRRYTTGVTWAASSTVDTLTAAGAVLLVRARYS